MKTRQKTLTALVCLLWLSCASLIMGQQTPAVAAEITEDTKNDAIRSPFVLPPAAPKKENFPLVSYFAVAAESEIIGFIALYDNPATQRRAHYLEFYDVEGNLLLIEWIDEFGIPRKAVDQALLEEKSSEPLGILVMVTEGIPL